MGSCVFVQLNFCFGRKIFVCFAFFFFPLSLSLSLSHLIRVLHLERREEERRKGKVYGNERIKKLGPVRSFNFHTMI